MLTGGEACSGGEIEANYVDTHGASVVGFAFTESVISVWRIQHNAANSVSRTSRGLSRRVNTPRRPTLSGGQPRAARSTRSTVSNA